jgi:uncharacterized protein with FMN-binding domain
MMKNFSIKGLSMFVLFAITALMISCGSSSFATIEASLPAMNGKPDGVYRGNYDLKGSPVKVTLDVTVQNEKITAIKIIKHFCSPIGKKAEKIIEQVIDKQDLKVDAVSGATGSSKAILKAVENALQ